MLFQISYWNLLQFESHPNMIPTSCIITLLSTWNGDEFTKIKLIDAADIALIDFYTFQESLTFSPSTIALAALITAFSMFNMDCSDFLKSIPNAFFMKSSNLTIQSLVNYEFCCEVFHRASQNRKRRQNALSAQHINYEKDDDLHENSESINIISEDLDISESYKIANCSSASKNLSI